MKWITLCGLIYLVPGSFGFLQFLKAFASTFDKTNILIVANNCSDRHLSSFTTEFFYRNIACEFSTDKVALDAFDLVFILDKTISISYLDRTKVWLIPDMKTINPVSLRWDNDIYVFKATYFGYDISEAYSLGGKDTITANFGIWNGSSGTLTLPSLSKYERRNNLRGRTLIGAYVPLPDFFEVDKKGRFFGSDYDIISELAAALNFTLVIRPSPDFAFGSKEPNGTWDGIIGLLERREVDFGSIGMMISNSRLQAVDYCHGAYFEEYSAITTAREKVLVDFWEFKDVFSTEVWLVFWGTIFVLAFYLAFEKKLSLFKATALVCAHCLLRDLPEVKPSKHFAFVSGLFGLVCFTAYSSLLIAFATTGPSLPAVKSYQDILDKGYQLAIWKNGGIHSIFKSALPGTIEHQISETWISEPEALFSSVEKAKDLMLKNPRIIVFDFVNTYVTSRQFTILPNFEKAKQIELAYPLQKNSELKGLFNHYIRKMHLSGLIDRIRRRWFPKERHIYENASNNPLGYENVMFPMTCLLFGTFSGLIIYCFELIGYRLQNKVNMVN